MFEELVAICSHWPVTTIIHGACGWDADRPSLHTIERLRGADRWAHEFAIERNLKPWPFPARWSVLGAKAGPIRNRQMVKESDPDYAYSFPGGSGTWQCCSVLESHGVPTVRVEW